MRYKGTVVNTHSGDSDSSRSRDLASIYRSMSGRGILLTPELLAARKAAKAVSLELCEWQRFISKAAQSGWIDLALEMPSIDVGYKYRDLLKPLVPDSLWRSLSIMYLYLEALTDAQDRIGERLDLKRRRQGSRNSDNVTEYIVGSSVGAAMAWGFWGAFRRSMRLNQLNDQGYQKRLKALPDALRILSHELDVFGSEAPLEEQCRLELADVPAVPFIKFRGTTGMRIIFEPLEIYYDLA